MHRIGVATGADLFGDSTRFKEPYRLFFDSPAAGLGVCSAVDLPHGIARYCGSRASDSGLTFVFGQLGGLGATIMWDSGANHQFVAKDFVTRHRLATQPGVYRPFLKIEVTGFVTSKSPRIWTRHVRGFMSQAVKKPRIPGFRPPKKNPVFVFSAESAK